MGAPDRKPGVAQRVLDWIWATDNLVLIAQIIAAVAVGFFVVGTWIVRLWAAKSWWHLALLSVTSLFLVGGFLLELRSRRIGPFGVFVLGFAVVSGAHHLLSRPA